MSSTSGRATDPNVVPKRMSTPRSRRPDDTRSPTKGSIDGSSEWPRTTIVTTLPSSASQVAASQATTPPPSTAMRAGISTRFVASRDVHGAASTSPGIGGIEASLPVAKTTASVACRRRPSTSTSRSPTSLPTPRTTSMPAPRAQSTCDESSRLWVIESRHASRRPGSG
ncbi:Uncharacterised protein [Mycobacteroides abscessus subsp. abscessus]|nr:Uncharacterised protein [Mycobacteroides abscessus subsp. abscessus]